VNKRTDTIGPEVIEDRVLVSGAGTYRYAGTPQQKYAGCSGAGVASQAYD
jgi:hypothetical protein